MEAEDFRWQQRFSNFTKAFGQLERFVLEENLNEMEKQGLIKAFEYTFELAWKTLQDMFRDKGYSGIVGPRPVIEQAFQDGYISDGKGWMNMQLSRNLTSHTYDEATANEIIANIRSSYVSLIRDLIVRLRSDLNG
jgi:nucleotidyltransferase substrate binding protein (TIGR01987 family)